MKGWRLLFSRKNNGKGKRGAERARKLEAWEMLRIIDSAMRDGRLFLDPSLSLAKLSAASGFNRTYVSQTLTSLSGGFYNYVNEYRIKYAFEVITDLSLPPMTLEELSIRSGFRDERALSGYCVKKFGMIASQYFNRNRPSH